MLIEQLWWGSRHDRRPCVVRQRCLAATAGSERLFRLSTLLLLSSLDDTIDRTARKTEEARAAPLNNKAAFFAWCAGRRFGILLL